jgi:uncharacterized protein
VPIPQKGSIVMTKQQALIFFGGWDGHQPRASALLARGILEARNFDVRLEESLDVLSDADTMKRFDLIVPIWTMGKITDAQASGLLEAVRDGAGLAGWHGGMGDAFRDHLEFKFAVGGQFVAHPGGIIDYTVRIARGDDPIVADLKDFAYRSEQYYMHVDPSNEVLATTTFSGEHLPWLEGCAMPVVWKRRWGNGKVFYSALGHDPLEFERTPEALEITTRGLVWAARG